jgi:hypothetical protein
MGIFTQFVLRKDAGQVIQPVGRHQIQQHAPDGLENAIDALRYHTDLEKKVQESPASLRHRGFADSQHIKCFAP